MSVVIGLVTEYGDVILGADIAAFDGNTIIPNLYEKVTLKRAQASCAPNGYVQFSVGACGSTHEATAVRGFLKLPKLAELDNIADYMETFFIAALKDAIRACNYHPPGLEESAEDTAGEFLVGVLGNVYFIDHAFNIVSSGRGYDAIGSGREVALGSLYTTKSFPDIGARDRVIMALDTAAALVANVAGPYTFVTAKGVEET
jgi:hypothetical protein